MRRAWLSVPPAIVLAALWAAFVGLVSPRLRMFVVALPVFALAFWLAFWRWRCFRFIGIFAVVPVSVVGFEVLQSVIRPSLDVHQHVTLDRSHFIPGHRVRMPENYAIDPGMAGWGEKEVLIGRDGFRADPGTRSGNPDRCRWALIGDSVIFGSGLPYAETLGPVLKQQGMDACVFGVGGNGPMNYLATLRYVGDRLEPGAHVVIYLFAGNDFSVWTLHVLSNARWWHALADLVGYYEHWRQATFTFRLVNGGLQPVRQPAQEWELRIGGGESLKLFRNPSDYAPLAPLRTRERRHLESFFERLARITRGRPWRVSVVVIPSGAEVLVNLASQNSGVLVQDPARVEVLEICKASGMACEDFTPYLYAGTVTKGKNPYFMDDHSHLSAFGTRVLAEHYQAISRRK